MSHEDMMGVCRYRNHRREWRLLTPIDQYAFVAELQSLHDELTHRQGRVPESMRGAGTHPYDIRQSHYPRWA